MHFHEIRQGLEQVTMQGCRLEEQLMALCTAYGTLCDLCRREDPQLSRKILQLQDCCRELEAAIGEMREKYLRELAALERETPPLPPEL